MNNYKVSQNCLDIVKHYEGFRSQPYICPAGVLTIGYGHTRTVKPGQKISKKEANDLLIKDLENAERVIRKYVKVPLSQNQFDALASFIFNLGEGNFRSSTLLLYLNAGKFNLVPDQIRRWTRSSGVVTEGLVRRRATEATLFETGKVIIKG